MPALNVLAIALNSVQQDSRRVEIASMNMANSLTTGYKRQFPAIAQAASTVQSHSHSAATDAHAGLLPVGGARSIAQPQSVADMRPGTLRATRRSLDVALTGPGFFEVLTPNGPAYTRHGEFQIDSMGRLVTVHGDVVMGESGEIVLTSQTPNISAHGQIEIDGKPVGQLKVVAFERPEHLIHQGNGRYVPSAEASRTTQTVADLNGAQAIRQGYLENANVNAMHDMLELMQSMRHMETMQKVTQYADDMLGTAIRRLGEF